MGRRGPPNTPLKLLEARGSKRTYDRKGEPSAPAGVPEYPPDWDDSRRVIWDRTISSLAEMQILSKADLDTIKAYVTAVHRFEKADLALQAHGSSFINVDGVNEIRAEAKEMDKAMELMMKFCARLGLSPSDRANVRGSQVRQTTELKGKGRFFGAG